MDADYVVVCFDGVYDERLVPLFREIYVMFEVFRLFFIADSAFESVESRLADRRQTELLSLAIHKLQLYPRGRVLLPSRAFLRQSTQVLR